MVNAVADPELTSALGTGVDTQEPASPPPAPPVVEDTAHLDASEAARIRSFEEENRQPSAIKSIMEAMPEDRAYVHTDANLADQDGGVASNYLLRYQWIHQAQVYAKDPSVSVRPKRKLGVLVPAFRLIIENFGKTIEYLVQHCADEGDLRAVVDGMIQDTDTVGIAFIKVNWIEDLGRDPTGTYRPNDFASQVRDLARLREDYEASLFTETDAKFDEMRRLAECVAKEVDAEHWRGAAYPTQQVVMGPDGTPQMGDAGLPVLADVPYQADQDPRRLRWDGVPTAPQITELPRYRGFVFDVFDPEDVTWDWRVNRPEFLHRGGHLSTRVWMERDQIRNDFQIPSGDDGTDYIPGTHTSDTAGDPATERVGDPVITGDTQTEERSGCLAVWERQCADGYVYTWVQGAKKFLRGVKRDVITSSRYNVFALYFNRVTGRVLPVSNTVLGRPLQNEINTVRTHKRQAKRAAYNRYFAAHDLLDDDEKKRWERCPPEGVVFLKKPIDDVRKGIMPINGQFNPAVHDVTEERQELSSMLNIPVSATGQTRDGADSATEAAIANQNSGMMADRQRGAIERLLRQVFTYISEVLIQALPEESAKAIAGPGAVWPMLDREALWSHLEVDIEAGSTGKPDQEKRMAAFREAMETAQLMGIGVSPAAPTWNYMAVLRKLADIQDWREDPEQLVQFPVLPPMPMGPAVGPGPGGGQPGPMDASQPQPDPMQEASGPMPENPGRQPAPDAMADRRLPGMPQ